VNSRTTPDPGELTTRSRIRSEFRRSDPRKNSDLKPLRHFLIAGSKLNFLECNEHFTLQTNPLKQMFWRLAADPVESFTDTVHSQ
jgi:hypothetical protein